MPGVEVESYNDIVYQSHGSTYAYKSYRVGDWRLYGMPDPTPEEVLAVLDTDPAEAFPFGTLDTDRELEMIEGEEPYWHTLESVSLKMRARYATAEGNQQANQEAVMEIRLYRDAMDAPWTRFMSSRRQATELSREPLREGIRTLKEVAEIAQYEAYAASLPEVEVPAFSSGMDLARFLYDAFRATTDRATLEATIRAVLPSSEFYPGTKAVDIYTQTWLDTVLDDLTGGTSSFAEQTCESPVINDNPPTRETDRIYIHSLLTMPPRGTAIGAMMVRTVQESAGYRNGQPVPGRWTLSPVLNQSLGGLFASTSKDADDLAWLRSFDDPSSLCTASGQAVQAATQEAQGATDSAREAVEGAVERGRRRLGRLLGGN